jgi:hypothetical protein
VSARRLLHRYWFTFGRSDAVQSMGLALGAGVTGYTRDDALSLLRAELAPREAPEVIDVTEDVRHDQLEQKHVVPNMHPMSERGVWFPMFRVFS